MLDTKENDFLFKINLMNKRLRNLVYNYLNFFSLKSEDYRENYLSYRANNSSLNVNNNDFEGNIIEMNENFLKNFENDLRSMNKLIENLNEFLNYNIKKSLITNKYDKEMFKYNDINKLKYLKNSQNRQTILRSNLVQIIFKYMITARKDSIIRDTIKRERILYLSLKNKNNNKFDRQGSEEIVQIDNLNDYIKQYIKTNFKESNIEFSLNVINYQSQHSSKFNIQYSFNNRQQINQIPINKYAKINIKIFPLNILIGLNLNKELLLKKNIISFYLKDELNRPLYNELILMKKIKFLLEIRLNSILDLIYEEKKRRNITNNNNSKIFLDEEVLKEFLKRFLYYINDYNKMLYMKCNFCQKIVKYSYIDKCFFPPFYKLYKEKEINKNDNETEQKLFFHEDCFTKMANSFL